MLVEAMLTWNAYIQLYIIKYNFFKGLMATPPPTLGHSITFGPKQTAEILGYWSEA